MAAPKPSLVKSTALAKVQNVFSRINSLLPSYSTPISPVTVYQPLPEALASLPNTTAVVGNALLAAPSGTPNVTTTARWGVWIAPNINNGADYQVQVETFAAGAGGGGGTSAIGGGGGAGGEYAAEPVYTVTPGLPYLWIRGVGGPGGTAQPVSGGNQAVQGGCGVSGGDTIFDLMSTSLPGGVHAHGGAPGDSSSGSGGLGGTGSANTLHSNGGSGGTTQSGVASDNPSAFASSSSYWAEPAGGGSPSAWLIMDDSTVAYTDFLNNQVSSSQPAGVQQFATAGLASVTSPAAPLQAPTASGLGISNPTQYAGSVQYAIGSITSPSARIAVNGNPGYSGKYLMISGWIQCDPSGTWGNPNNSNSTIATNCTYGTPGKAGVALFISNTGSAGNPVWTLNWRCQTSVSAQTTTITSAASAITPTPGTWYYVVAIFNAGAMSLYCSPQGGALTLVASGTASGFTSVPAGGSGMTLGMRASNDANLGWYFGYMSNFWFAPAVPATLLLNTAFGLTSATGGSGGGSSGGPYLASANTLPLTTPYTNGNTGTGATTSAGASGGTVPTQSAYAASITTNGEAGGLGSAAGGGNATTANFAAGGGGSGTSATPLTVQTLTLPITAAATYNGVDGSQPGVLYNPTQQGTQSTLVAGGQSSDPVTGSKNSILLLQPGLLATLQGKTIVDVYLTVYNANSNNVINPVLEINYSNDLTIPANYELSQAYLSQITQVAPYILQDTPAAQVISLNNTGFKSALKNSTAGQTATAIVLGPGGTVASPPTFDAYNAPAGNYFYTSIYGPGSTDSFGNSLEPVLTVIYTNSTPQQGETGGDGVVAVTVINNEGVPVAAIQPFATVDGVGDTFAQGFTGPIQNWGPLTSTPGAYVPEVWQTVTFSGGFPAGSGYIRVKRLAESNFCMLECELTFTALAASVSSLGIGSFPSAAYYPLTGRQCVGTIGGTSTDATVLPRIFVNTSGALQLFIPKGATALSVNFMYATD